MFISCLNGPQLITVRDQRKKIWDHFGVNLGDQVGVAIILGVVIISPGCTAP